MDFQSEKSFGKLRLRAFQPYHQIPCMLKHVKDVKDGKRTYRHTFIILFLIWYHLNIILCMSKMSKIDQIHLRAVMLCMSKMSKMGKEHTHTSSTSSTCFDIHRIWGMVGKLSVSAFTYPVLFLNYNVDCNSMSSNYSKILNLWFTLN